MYITVTVAAGSKKDSVVMNGKRYVVSTREPAENGRANDAALRLLAAHLEVPTGSLALVRGAHKPSKLFLLRR